MANAALEERNPTVRDVARLAKVGVMTVSRVINDHPSVRPATRKRVESAILALHYKQNEAARLLKGRRARMIGLIVPDLSDPFFALCAHTVQQIARASGYMTLVVSSERDAALEVQEAELMASRKVSGLLVVTSLADNDERLHALQSDGLAIVAIERPLHGLETDAVVTENRHGAELATNHLVEHGHKRIAAVGYDPDVYTTRERLTGYEDTMRAHGLEPRSRVNLSTYDALRTWIAETMHKEDSPTAFFASNNRTSVFLLRALAEEKLAIPDDVALIGFDDFDLASVLCPPMTTVSQGPVDLFRRAATLLMQRIADINAREYNVPAKIVLPVTLIVRSSCGCNSHWQQHPHAVHRATGTTGTDQTA